MFDYLINIAPALGFCFIAYSGCRLLRLWSLSLEDHGKDHGLLSWLLIAGRFVLGFLSLPVLIVFSFFESQTIKRIDKMHDKEISSIHSDYIKKCAYCRSQNNYEYYEPEESHPWDPVEISDYDD